MPEHSGTNHSMAVGFYIAAIVLIFGVTLVLAGILSSGQQVEGNLGFNLNLWWGLVMVVSGCVILGMSLASPRRRAAREARNCPYSPASATTTLTPASSISRSISSSAPASVTRTSTFESGAIFASATTPSLE